MLTDEAATAAFEYLSRVANPPLDLVVESLFYSRGQIDYREERILPNGRMTVIWGLADPFEVSSGGATHRLGEAWLIGPRTEYLVNRPLGVTHVLGAVLQPWGCYALLGVPADEIVRATLDLESVLGREIARWRELLWETACPRESLDLLERLLIARCRLSDPPPRRVVGAARAMGDPGHRVGDLAREMGISRQRLHALFRQHVGLPPKAFSRISRFNRALELMVTPGGPSLDQVAYECGYSDQAHFTRDFRAFSGESPSGFFTLRREVGAEDDPHLFIPYGDR